MARSSAGLDERRRRLLYRAWHRGMQEMDWVMGRFADATLADLTDEEVAEFERLSDLPDVDLYRWILGKDAVPPEHDGALLRKMRDFHAGKPA